MQLEHSFTVPVPVDQAWAVLLDIEAIAPCLPGASIDSVDGDSFTGTVKVKLGPIGLTYKGKASFTDKEVASHRAVITAQGRDSRGNGTAKATVTATLLTAANQPAQTSVVVVTELDITGKPAQFGRSVLVDVGNKLIGQFADCLSSKLAAEPPPSQQPTAVAQAVESTGSLRPIHIPPVPPIDLLGTAAPALVKRLPAFAVIAAALTAAVVLCQRRRRGR